MLKKSALALAAATLLIAGCDGGADLPAAANVTFYVTDGASIYTGNALNTLLVDEKPLTGLNSGTLLYAIDVNPKGGGLNGIGSDGQSYLINPTTGAATKMGAPDTTEPLTNKAVEIDYNPTVANQQVYRVTTSTGQNYRRNDTTGAKPGTDSQFFYKTGDVNAGKSVVISGIAYTNSQLNTAVPASTTVYAIDSQNAVLTILGGNPADGAPCPNTTNPNCGQLTTVGPLNIAVNGVVGFDILGPSAAYATAFKDGTYNLYSVSLTTGALTFLTAMNPKIVPVRSFAVKQP